MEQILKYKGYNIEIVADNDADSPRTAYDNCGVMCCWHSRYNLGDMESNGKKGRERSYEPISKGWDGESWLEHMANIDTEVDDYEFSGRDCLRMIREQGTVILPLYLYDHSGITMNTKGFSCGWDSGQVGWIYITKDKIEAESWTPEQAEKYLEGEVQVYDDYLTGNVYGYKVTDADGEDKDSCWGYYGDPEESGCIDEAKGMIDWYVKKDQEEYEKLPKKRAVEMYTV